MEIAMRARYCLILAGCLFATVATPSAAQDIDQVCQSIGDLDIGDWAQYEMSGAAVQGQSVESIRFAIVGEEDTAEGSMVWYEFDTETAEGSLIVKMLVTGWPFEMSGVKDVILKMGGQPAMRVPQQMLAMMQEQMATSPIADFAKQCRAANFVGEETVETPAGTFHTLHVHTDEQNGDAWVSAEVPFGMVKGSSQDGPTMVLVQYGTDAVSQITETPVDMPGMPGSR